MAIGAIALGSGAERVRIKDFSSRVSRRSGITLTARLGQNETTMNTLRLPYLASRNRSNDTYSFSGYRLIYNVP